MPVLSALPAPDKAMMAVLVEQYLAGAGCVPGAGAFRAGACCQSGEVPGDVPKRRVRREAPGCQRCGGRAKSVNAVDSAASRPEKSYPPQTEDQREPGFDPEAHLISRSPATGLRDASPAEVPVAAAIHGRRLII
ncbi:hypothetical protein CB1_000592001 [Camelus ferus]|nr:hypothetical protein CB1_000592001 [Camelus ferus]